MCAQIEHSIEHSIEVWEAQKNTLYSYCSTAQLCLCTARVFDGQLDGSSKRTRPKKFETRHKR